MEEFRSNLMLLLHCRYPQGMLLDKLEEEYEKYYLKRVEPYMFFSEAPSWRNVFEKTYLHNDLKLFEINNTVYVKPVGIRSEAEMALIAKLAKYSHFHYAQDTFFQLRDCTCCQQVYQSFNTLNHYTSGTSLSTAQAVAAVSNQYATAPAGQIQQQQQTGDQFRTVQYVAAAPTTIQGTTIQGASTSATNLSSTTLTMNGGLLKYDTRFEDPNLRAAATGDYYIMLQGTQGNTIQGRYDSLGNLTSPPIQTHRTTETSINQQQQQPQQQQVVYATTPTATAQGTQQWNFSRTTGEVTVATPQQTTPTSTPTTNNKSKKGSNQSQAATPKSSKSTPAGKEIHYCRWEGCKKSFRRLKLLENHERAAHVQGSGGGGGGEDGLSCSTVGCDKKFPDKKQLQHHESRCELKPHRCSWEGCDKTFRTSKLLHGHISAVHRKIGRNTYKCSIPGCQQAYPDSTKLRTHEVRCKFRYETLADMKMETDAAEAAAAANAALLVTANAVGDVTTVPTVTANVAAAVSSANNLTASSVTGGGATNEDAMNMSMTNSSIEGNKQPASTVDLSFMVKNEVGGEEQCFVPQTHI